MPPRTAKLIKQLIKDGSLVIRKDLENVVHKNGLFNLKFKMMNNGIHIILLLMQQVLKHI